jgi:tetratricopeptide (TPR) repeat protein
MPRSLVPIVYQLLRRLIFCAIGICFAGAPSALGQNPPPVVPPQPTPVIPPPETSPSVPATKIKEMRLASTPLNEALQLYRMGEFDRAVNQYERITEGGTDQAAAYAGLARVYLKLKKPDAAFAAAKKAVDRDPLLLSAHSALGEVYIRQGKLYEAQEEFLLAIKRKPTDARSYLGLSRLYRATFNFKKAKVNIDVAHELDPIDPEISAFWMDTRPRSEEMKALENAVASQTNFHSRAEKADFKRRLVIMKDQDEHPERTCTLKNPPASAELPLLPINNWGAEYPVGLEVRVNGQKSRLRVDANMTGITITEKMLKMAAVQMIVHTAMDDLGDQNPPEGYIGFVPSIAIGDLEFSNCYVNVIEKASPGSIYAEDEGRIAARFFSRYLVDLDLPNAKLRLQPLPSLPAAEDPAGAEMDAIDPDAKKFHDRYRPPEMAGGVEFCSFGGVIIVPVRVNDSLPKLFGMAPTADTFIGLQLAREAVSLSDAPHSTSHALNGTIAQTFSTGRVRLEFGHFYYVAAAELAIDLSMDSDKAGTERSGTLGFDVMHNFDIKIDYRDGIIQFSNDIQR